MKRPHSIRIGGQAWCVRSLPESKMDESSGLCHYDTAVIDLATLQTPFNVRDTLLHETFHAILASQGRTSFGNDEEELYVRALATGLMGVLQDNPQFAQWLVEPLTKPT